MHELLLIAFLLCAKYLFEKRRCKLKYNREREKKRIIVIIKT